MKELFCAYCRTFKPGKGFKVISHLTSNTTRRMCPSCQEVRTKPRSELQRLADKEKTARKENP